MEERKDILDNLQKVKIEMPSDDFFTELGRKVVNDNPRLQNNTLKIRRIIYMSVSIAAILIIGFFIISRPSQDLNQNSEDITFADLDDKEIKKYLNENDHEISDDLSAGDFIEPIKDTVPLVPKKVDDKQLEKMFSELSEEEIMLFFNSEGIDPEELEEEEFINF